MITSELASLIIGIEENVRAESAYYGKPVEWREKYQTWHYGIGLSDTHFFSLGTLEKQELQLLKRHDIRDFDLRILPDVKSPFESDEVIERLKYALRWLDDLPENSSQKTITGKGLAFQILTGNPDYEYSRDTKPIPPDLSYEDYLKQSCPKLKPSKYFLKNPQVWAYMFLFIFVLFAAILTPPLFDLIKNLIGSIPWLESRDNLVENISKILLICASSVRKEIFNALGLKHNTVPTVQFCVNQNANSLALVSQLVIVLSAELKLSKINPNVSKRLP
jgi:hypothetical protein